MKILVIGGNGFIGSRLVIELRDSGHSVRVVDHGEPRHDLDWSGVDYHRTSLSDRFALTRIFHGIDVICHCASSTVPSTSNLDPVRDIEQNLIGAVNVLEAMRASNVRRIVYLSSGGTVYGNPRIVPVPEEHELSPISSYGVVKVAIEKYLLMYQALYGVEPVILRPSNPYGPGQMTSGLQGLIGSFLGKLAEGSELPVWGDGEVVRDYLYIGDLVGLIRLAIERPTTGIFNVGSGTGCTVNEIISELRRVTGLEPQIRRMDGRSFDVGRVVLDITRAKQTFGWAPSVRLDEGLDLAWQWVRQRRS
ncbi:NAD-dependent epimerase/dehydratase family protein [Luteibacter sp. Lutesp34]|uniref:NAD-dependent epimerase/dehydratase family protein n=1 Tax=Luteibacter sp. Lutesp34 TaxID=3243030 RepID=UPI0039B43F9E